MKKLLAALLISVLIFATGCSGGGSGSSSGTSGTTSGTTGTPTGTTAVPPAPAGLMATGGNAQVSLSWAASAGAATYTVYYGTTSGVTAASANKVAGLTATSSTITNLSSGTPYFFVVSATNTAGESPVSAQTTATPTGSAAAVPAAPSVLVANASDSQVILKWADSTGAVSYNLYYSLSPGVTTANGTKIAGITSTAYVQTGLTNGSTYYYIVTAVGATGESLASVQASAKPSAPAPAAPTALTAIPGNAQVALSWTASANATGYTIYYGNSASVSPTSGTRAASVSGTSYSVTGLANGTVYYFIVTAANTGGESVATSAASATPSAGANTNMSNLGVAVLTDSASSVQVVHLYDSKGILLAKPTITTLTYSGTNYFESVAISPDGSQGLVVGTSAPSYSPVAAFFSGLQTGTLLAAKTGLNFSSFNTGSSGYAAVILPNGDEAVLSVGSNTQLVVLSGILTGSPVTTVTIPTQGNRNGLVMSQDGKVLLARGLSGLAVYAVASITPKAGTLGGTISHSYTLVKDFAALSTLINDSARSGMAFSPADSSRAVVIRGGSTGGTIQVMSGLTSTSPLTGTSVFLPGAAVPESVAVSLDGKLAVVGTSSAGLLLYSGVDTGNLALIGTTSNASGISLVRTIGITLDGKYVVAIDNNAKALVVVPFSSSGFSAPASAILIGIPGTDELIIH